ncbi:hypothetical protein B5M45_19455 [Mycobacterium simiae]|uniref:Uncharacterized protein n=1 Tax=Mycobacterium simiae TaxID=1784 RepID=A0A1X0XY12_MYCSI|nr:hypothetical protein B5M45_19455 [Mycobacterium simiae]
MGDAVDPGNYAVRVKFGTGFATAVPGIGVQSVDLVTANHAKRVTGLILVEHTRIRFCRLPLFR